MKSFYFKRLEKELSKLSPHFKLKRLKLGFYRIFWKNHYVGECYEEMPSKGFDIVKYDPRLESQKYYEEYEDHVKLVRTIKNFIEGYYDTIKKMKRCLWLLRTNKEYFETSKRVGQKMNIK